MRQNKKDAFILADSLVALTIVSLSITFTLTCHQCMMQQNKRLQTNLVASRLAKEATDELAVTHHPIYLRRNEYSVVASSRQVVVYLQGERILEVTK
ncbi:MAG: type II secretion system GspH family protein [Limosilactobacillus sp.]|uniref:type II secretion system protein n=1 Tax=Limosilactobacillus sp. TaxID=2773925 RepID=UPI0025C39EDF|nr:type II secretion system protein [Limosilactobacillus sp.]MCI1975390.1 type II secretion system GspH family protein [Limosilactobacillus sp.]MCI2031115.1 type II secretion system GspH family protein [Limosilactobacillus sp.]